MPNFTTKQGSLFYCYAPPKKQIEKIDQWLAILDQSGVAEIIDRTSKDLGFGRPGLDPYAMFATIVFGFAFGAESLRNLESSCKNDIRFMYLMNGEQPNYSTFCKFINIVIKPFAKEIFSRIVKTYFKKCNITMEECHIDGTKFQAKPNKYKAVWKPTRYHEKLSEKIRSLLSGMNLSRGVPAEGFIPSTFIAAKITEAKALLKTLEGAEQKIYLKKINSLTEYLEKTLEYEEKELICGPNRNSYFKTDHDATAMCLKEDYYSGLGSNMHAAYQMQAVVCHGFVVSYYVSQDRSDMHTFIPSLNRFRDMYGKYPDRITADSGYGCLENYQFCKNNNIEAYIKYLSWQGEASARKPALYELNADETITCLGGKVTSSSEVAGRHHKIKSGKFYKVSCDLDCPFMPYCRQWHKEEVGKERVFEISVEYQRLKQEARDRLLSVKGIEMRVNRSCQIEGVYGITKFDIGYNRIRRIGMDGVETEYMLTILGLNTRKLFRFLEGRTCLKYWEAPDGLEPEKFKKPSAKRLANRARKARAKSVNETARDSYKHKKFTKK